MFSFFFLFFLFLFLISLLNNENFSDISFASEVFSAGLHFMHHMCLKQKKLQKKNNHLLEFMVCEWTNLKSPHQRRHKVHFKATTKGRCIYHLSHCKVSLERCHVDCLIVKEILVKALIHSRFIAEEELWNKESLHIKETALLLHLPMRKEGEGGVGN